MWDRSYRPQFSDSKYKRNKLDTNKHFKDFDSQGQSNQIRRIIYGDRAYMRYFDETWGLDFLG